MFKKMSSFVFVFMFLISGLSYGAVSSGSTAPDFTLTDSNGESHSLSDYKGKYVVLEWINHDCPFVKKHYESGNMQSLQKEFGEKGVVWFSVASSAPGKQGHYDGETWNELTSEKGAEPKAVLLDPSGKVGKLYGAKTTPHMYVVNPEGTLIYQGAIDSKPSANPKDVQSAENYVSSALNTALSGNEVSVDSTKAYGCSVKYA